MGDSGLAWPAWLGPWRRRQPAVDESRWVVVDVETSGLDPRSDRLLAIAAIAMRLDWSTRRMTIAPGDSFEVVLRQPAGVPADKANILVHGIGLHRQSEGVEPSRALQAFGQYVASSPLLAFHAGFDEAVLRRACRHASQPVLRNPWADIEALCADAFKEKAVKPLDDWLDRLGIACAHRHQAAADALAECEVLLRVWPRMAPQCRSWADVVRLAASQRWIRR
jgi:DNA polymerase III subunit epsilon